MLYSILPIYIEMNEYVNLNCVEFWHIYVGLWLFQDNNKVWLFSVLCNWSKTPVFRCEMLSYQIFLRKTVSHHNSTLTRPWRRALWIIISYVHSIRHMSDDKSLYLIMQARCIDFCLPKHS